MRGRLMVGHGALDAGIGVRIPAPQPVGVEDFFWCLGYNLKAMGDEFGVRWGLVFATAIVIFVLVFSIFSVWYYTTIFAAKQREAQQKARLEAIELQMRQKYCLGGEYANETIRRFCEGE